MIKALLVDDANFMKMMLKKIINNSDLNIEIVGEAMDGEEGLKLYKELKPDIVTMDITMPKMDGLEACKKINQYDPDAKVMMVSAMGQQAMVAESIQNGAKDFIVKPFKKDKVIESFRKVVS